MVVVEDAYQYSKEAVNDTLYSTNVWQNIKKCVNRTLHSLLIQVHFNHDIHLNIIFFFISARVCLFKLKYTVVFKFCQWVQVNIFVLQNYMGLFNFIIYLLLKLSIDWNIIKFSLLNNTFLTKFWRIKEFLIVHKNQKLVSQKLIYSFLVSTVVKTGALYELHFKNSSFLRIVVAVNLQIFLVYTDELFSIEINDSFLLFL